MAITGSQKSQQFALGGVARGGAFRAGAVPPKLFVSVGGIHRAYGQSGTSYRVRDLTVDDTLGEVPNTCRFTAIGFTPTVGMDVIITLGSMNSLTREFGGQILNVEQTYLADNPDNQAWNVSAIDYTWGLGKRKVAKKYTSTTIAVIAADLIASYASGYTVTVEATFGATTIDEFSATNDDLPDVLSRLVARGGGYWLCDYFKVVRLFTSDTSSTAPTQLTAAHPTMRDLQVSRDLSQMITRVYFEGMGSTATATVAPGDTILPVASIDMFPSGGGLIVSGPQRISYTGHTEVSPLSAPTATIANGSGVDTGAHSYGYTYTTVAGETLPSPLATITTGPLSAPATAVSANASGGGLSSLGSGAYQYAVTFVTAVGETTASASTSATTVAMAAPGLVYIGDQGNGGSALGAGVYQYAATFVTASGETTPGPVYNVGTLEAGHYFFVGADSTLEIGPAGTTARKIYRTAVNGSQLKLVGTVSDNTSRFYGNDTLPDASLGANAPTSNTAGVQVVALSSIPTGTSGVVTSRKVYRTAAGGSQLKLLATLADNASTTLTDSTADASLGANVPTSNTAARNHVSLSGITTGPSGTTGRKIYRTAAGGSQLKLLTTFADVVTTTYADTTADASLGANAPTSDTSGLSITGFSTTSGSTSTGATSITLVATTAFISTGGWAQIGDMTFRYTGKTVSTLTGIPATGIGSITGAVPSGTLVQALIALIGIPTSGAGSIQYSITTGDEVQLLVQVDDVSAQTTLAGLIGGDGIQETYVQDRRMSYTEARARATALLAQRGVVDTELRFTTRDLHAKSGRTQSVNVSAPMSVSGDFIIQQSTLTAFPRMTDFASSPTPIGPTAYPQRTIRASSNRFTFEDLLRQSRKEPT
jgi:hypothetical protein